MNELGSLFKRRPGYLFLKEVLDGLDVVISRSLDLLDASGVLDGELRGNRPERLALGSRKRFAFGDLLGVAKSFEPNALDENAALN